MSACTKAPSSNDAGPEVVDGAAGSNANAGGSSSSNGGASAADGVTDDKAVSSDFEGIPDDKVPYGAAPAVCTSKASATADTLEIQLTAKLTNFVLASKKGVLQMNGVACTAKNPKLVKIIGTTTVDTIIIDFSKGDFPDSLKAGSISIDGGSAKDIVAIAATRDGDDIHIGSTKTDAALRIGAGQPLIQIKTVETLIVSAGPGEDQIDATGGADLGTAFNVALVAYGGADTDTLLGGSAGDTLYGGDGDDLFRSSASPDGADIIDGGDGMDTVSYELRTESVTLTLDQVANDGETNERDNVKNTVEILIGGMGDDTITGSDMDNTLIGGPGNDFLNGGKGDDTFIEKGKAEGTDVMNGGPGSDTVDYSEREANMLVSLCIGIPASCATGACGCWGDDGEAGENDTLVNIENATTGSGDDKLEGSSADNTLRGGDGNDQLTGLAGNDALYGEGGDDVLNGGPGDDLLVGGDGINTFDGGDDQGDICITHGVEVPLNCELH